MTPTPNKPTTIPVLDLGPQYAAIGADILTAIERVAASGAFILGPDVTAFEHDIATYLGTPHAIGVNSGTDALVLALRALGIGPGDEVITTPFTFFATAEAISHVGATPVFADIDPTTYNLDPAAVETAITPHTKAILPVHLYGRPAPMTELMTIANHHGLRVIEDCAQSMGARVGGTGAHTGTIGDLGAYSFFPSKNLGAYGDGGLVTTNNADLADTVTMLRAHGARRKYYNETLGYNSRLDTIQAAILRVKLPHLDTWNNGRRRVASIYNDLLGDHPHVICPDVVPGHVFHQYTIRITHPTITRDAVQQHLTDAGINTMIYYPVCVHRLPIYNQPLGTCPTAEHHTNQTLSLPIWPELDEPTITTITTALTKALDA